MMGRTGKEGGMRMKNIFAAAVFITVVMAIVLVAFSSTVSATLYNRTYTLTGGNITYTGGFESEPDEEMKKIKDEKTGEISNVYAGEKIRFLCVNGSVSVTVSGPYTKAKAEEYSGVPHIHNIVDAEEEWDSEGKPTKGYYRVEDSNLEGGWFQLMTQSFSVEIAGKKEKVREGENFSLRIKSNNKKQGVMKLTLEDNEGFSITNVNDTDIYEVLVAYKKEREFVGFADNKTMEEIVIEDVEGINISEDKELVFDTSKLDIEEGKYKIILEDYATEAKDDVKIEAEKRYLKVECDDVVKGEDIVIIIRSSFYKKEANVIVEGIPEKEGKKKVKLDEDGKKKVKIHTENVDYGTYEITVEICGDSMKETKYVTVKRSGTSLEVPEDATVGDIVHIKGTAASGDFAVVLVDDVFKNKARISDEKFAWDWDTGGEPAEYREIEVFIVNESELPSTSVGETIGDAWQQEHGVDASATIFLFLPMFSMTVPKCIAEGDDVVVSGTAIGTAHVFVIAINYKGEVVFPPGGTAGAINARTTSVEDGKWEETISELDSGRYTVIALYEGKDGITDAIKGGMWEAGDKGKTLEQRVAILEDAITSAGSDDLFERAEFSVHAPKVILKEPKTVVEIGDEITVKAETNIREGEKAFISLFQNSSSNNLKKTFARVENGSVNASINTSGLLPGKYNIAVDISGRASAEKEITLVDKKEVVEEGKEEIAQNVSVTEPGTAEEANESIGEEKDEINESYEEEEKQKIPINVWDLLIAVVVASAILAVARRRRGRR